MTFFPIINSKNFLHAPWQIAPLICLLIALAMGVSAQNVHADGGAIKVELRQVGDAWQLLRDGKPYIAKGAGGNASLSVLAQSGANSFRVWSADNLQAELDQAQALGLTVCVGFWLGQPQQGFDYEDPELVGKQLEQIRKVVYHYRNHPAVLLWAIGNEAEGWGNGDDPSYWKALNDIGAMVKKMDPNHPTMTVTAEIGGARVSSLNEFCPDIDIHGINSYGGCATLPERYRKAGGKKPYIITEFGPPGDWEVTKNAYGMPPEPTSTEKAAHYKESYDKAIAGEFGKLCLGSYAFDWGSKAEASATWFGMFLRDGSRLAAVDTMSELWTGKPVANPCPRIDSLKIEGDDDVAAGTVVKATLKASDPSGDPLTVTWALYPQERQYQPLSAGDPGQVIFPGAVQQSSIDGAEVKMPAGGGGYRLYVYIYNKHGGAATGNLCLHVKGPVAALKLPGQKVKLPLVIVGQDTLVPYGATGWMGNSQRVSMDGGCTDNPRPGQKTCLKVAYRAGDLWAGVVWQDPPGDWGDMPGGYDLTGATKMTLWARGDKGGEKVQFGFGALTDKKFNDTASAKTEFTLTTDWKQYTIDLKGKDLTCIKTGFMWVVAGAGQQTVFYVDDVKYEP